MKTAFWWASALMCVSVGTAHAHVALRSPAARTTMQKDQHCGGVEGRANVTTLRPGSQITVQWDETIDHPGYFRIAFQSDGEEFRIPAPGPGADGWPDEDLTGMTDPGASGSVILLDQIADRDTDSSDRAYTATVTLPNVECNNCTLQLIQVMTDKRPYTTDLSSDDIYFQCADVVLSNSAPDAGGGPGPDAAPGTPDAAPDGGNNSSGGCRASNGLTGGPAALVVALMSIFFGRGRRRRS